MVAQVAAFLSRHWSVPGHLLEVQVQPLHGGLESAVALARITRPEGHGAIPRQVIIKQLPAGFEREAEVYAWLWRHFDPPPAVRVFGHEIAGHVTFLYLEVARPSVEWPWRNTQLGGAVCRALARVHDRHELPREPFAWDYEAQLARSAEATVALAASARDAFGCRCWHRLGDLRRVSAALPRIRERLLSGQTTIIHGDVHPGNVILRNEPEPEVLFIDWARARLGSPLEDVASWLHSLGCWEPEARRRHDTLMRMYLDARRVPCRFEAGVRADYWLASASNGLSGAIRYHLAVLSDPETSGAARYDSTRALEAWQRVVRRAAGVLSTSHDRRTRAPHAVRRSPS